MGVRQRGAVRRVGGGGRVGVEGHRGQRPGPRRGRGVRGVRREPQLLAAAVLRHVVELARRGLAKQQLVLVLVLMLVLVG